MTDHELVAELLASPGVAERAELAGPVAFLAFHGGMEGGTETIAELAAEASGASLYTLVQPPTLRWHLPSHVIGRGASPALARVLDHVEVTIALHGYGRWERPFDILVGGTNRDLAAAVAGALRPRLPESVVVDDLARIPVEMRGLHPTNPVNLTRAGGVQLELPPGVRGATWRWEDRGACTPDPGLVAALAQVARAHRRPEPTTGPSRSRPSPSRRSTPHSVSTSKEPPARQ